MNKLPRVKKVEILDKRRVRLEFTDGALRQVDLEPLLKGPIFEPVRMDEKMFRSIRVDEQIGTIVWENGADMDPDVLYGSHQPAWMDRETVVKK